MNCNYVRQQKESKLTRAEERELQKKFYEKLEKSLENTEEPPTYDEWLKNKEKEK